MTTQSKATETTKLANIKDIKELAEKIPDNWALCELFAGTRRASEAEMMVAQTLHACVINHKKRGEAFSFRGDGCQAGRSGGGLVDNLTAYNMLLERGYFVEEERGGKVIIQMTQKLVDLLRGHLAERQDPQ